MKAENKTDVGPTQQHHHHLQNYEMQTSLYALFIIVCWLTSFIHSIGL